MKIFTTRDIVFKHIRNYFPDDKKWNSDKWISVESEIEFLSDLLYDGLYNDNYRTYVKIESRIKKLKGSDDE